MAGQRRSTWLFAGLARVVGWVGCSALPTATLLAADPPAAQPPARRTAAPQLPAYWRPMQEDAELADVTFVDSQHGWAVGDRGTIWHTIDAGRNWRLQASGVDCRLESVCFLDAANGWVAGGSSRPYTHTSHGVLLRTRDGGRTWHRDRALLLPALKRVEFFSPAVGWAIGEPSAMFPTGVLATDNAGRSWVQLVGRLSEGWMTADFADPFTGAIAGRHATLAAVRRRTLEESRTPEFGLRGLHRLKLAGPAGGWLVGDGGLVLVTGDLGRTWQLPAADPGRTVGRQFDWRALEVRGNRCWIAGEPGTVVLHTADAGQTWLAQPTRQCLPIHALSFVDDLRGWAVGALGVILATADGGKSWQRQRSGGSRVALLAVYSEPTAVPLEVVARLAAHDGYLTAVELINRHQDPDAPPTALEDRARQALIGLGASAVGNAWAFPLPDAQSAPSTDELVETWNRANDGNGVERLEECLVRRIRTWRPDVVVTHGTSRMGEDALGHVINQVVLRCVAQAADGTRFPEHVGQMGLAAWQVKKVFGRVPGGQLGTVNLATAQLAPRLGESLADFVSAERGLIADRYAAPPENVGCALFINALSEVGERDFFSRVALHPGGDARRTLIEAPDGGADLMKRSAQKHRNVQALLVYSGRNAHDPSHFLAQLADLTRGLDSRAAGEVIYQLAQRFLELGQWQQAEETLQLLVDRYPEHPLAEASLVWLIQYWASGEAAWRVQRIAQARIQQAVHMAEAGAPQPEIQLTAAQQPLTVPPSRSQGVVAAVDATVQADRLQRAAALGRLLEQRFPAAHAEPFVRFPLAAAERKQGLARLAQRYCLEVNRCRPHDAWWSCATGELWLGQGGAQPPRSVLHAATGLRPRLDGKLDDPIWAEAKAAELHGPGEGDDAAAEIRIAYDEQFLYIAMDCRRAAAAEEEAVSAQRPRDGDLSGHDRVEVLLDLDRDRTSCYRLSVDDRGWTGEACWGDVTWDPNWYVASQATADHWTVEAAIPLAELTGEPPKPKSAWALGIQRTIPGVGFQSWSRPAGPSISPEGFGLLIFD